MESNLLEILVVKSGCSFMSDLPLKAKADLPRQVIEDLAADDFSLIQWNEAIHYITRIDNKFATCEEAKEYLCQYLK